MLDTVTSLSLLRLYQWCDSSFPAGAFSHSFGLETYIQGEQVKDKRTFREWFEAYIQEQLVYTDGLAFRLAWEALDRGELEAVWELDLRIHVQNMARETREAGARMAERMLKLGIELYTPSWFAQYLERIRNKESYGHPSLVFAMVAHHLEIPSETALLSYLYSSTASLIQNGIRGIPLGQTEGQLLVQELQDLLLHAVERIQHLGYEEFGITAPGLELAQMQHERLNIRIFMS